MKIAYDGTAYNGWQIQPNATTIQELIRDRLRELLQEPISIAGSGRTDRGVHANGQVAHFETARAANPLQLKKSLNALLPPDIRILEIQEAAADFHARYSAKEKSYRYHVHTSFVQPSSLRWYALHHPLPLDQNRLTEALPLFLGTHNFKGFANDPSRGSAEKKPIKTMHELSLEETVQGFILTFRADGFLYKMVRNIVGTLLEIATDKRPLSSVPLILTSQDRRLAGKAAPPHGLFLEEVLY